LATVELSVEWDKSTGGERTMGKKDETGPLLIAAPLSLSGRYAFQGRLAAVGLAQAVKDVARLGGVPLGDRRLIPEVAIIDDESTRAGVRRALEKIARADLLIGPYGSDLVGEAAGWVGQKGRVLWNHGGSADKVQRLPGVVSIASPASTYFPPILEALGQSLPQARVLLAVGRGSFPEEVAKGAREAANRLGMDVITAAHGEVPGSPDSDVLLAAGTFAEDVALIGHLRQRPAAVGAVAAGIASFHVVLGALADGVLGPSQWEESARFAVDVGHAQMDVVRGLRAELAARLQAALALGHVEYLTAQAYATGLIAMQCVMEAEGTEDEVLLETARRLRCTTFFGRFGLGEDGRQSDHDMLVVQWQEGLKRVVWPRSQAEDAIS
jgi:branched-chain amino acid transport system substrate-binding protein